MSCTHRAVALLMSEECTDIGEHYKYFQSVMFIRGRKTDEAWTTWLPKERMPLVIHIGEGGKIRIFTEHMKQKSFHASENLGILGTLAPGTVLLANYTEDMTKDPNERVMGSHFNEKSGAPRVLIYDIAKDGAQLLRVGSKQRYELLRSRLECVIPEGHFMTIQWAGPYKNACKLTMGEVSIPHQIECLVIYTGTPFHMIRIDE